MHARRDAVYSSSTPSRSLRSASLDRFGSHSPTRLRCSTIRSETNALSRPALGCLPRAREVRVRDRRAERAGCRGWFALSRSRVRSRRRRRAARCPSSTRARERASAGKERRSRRTRSSSATERTPSRFAGRRHDDGVPRDRQREADDAEVVPVLERELEGQERRLQQVGDEEETEPQRQHGCAPREQWDQGAGARSRVAA